MTGKGQDVTGSGQDSRGQRGQRGQRGRRVWGETAAAAAAARRSQCGMDLDGRTSQLRAPHEDDSRSDRSRRAPSRSPAVKREASGVQAQVQHAAACSWAGRREPGQSRHAATAGTAGTAGTPGELAGMSQGLGPGRAAATAPRTKRDGETTVAVSSARSLPAGSFAARPPALHCHYHCLPCHMPHPSHLGSGARIGSRPAGGDTRR